MTGAKAHVARLKRLAGPEMDRKIGAALFAAGQRVQVEAQLSITRGAVSGAAHVPSRPGEPPNQDTGTLGNNIETVQIRPDLVEVSSNAPYSAPLEFGSSRIAARPFMRPARDKTRPAIEDLIIKAVKSLVRGSGRGR